MAVKAAFSNAVCLSVAGNDCSPADVSVCERVCVFIVCEVSAAPSGAAGLPPAVSWPIRPRPIKKSLLIEERRDG